MTNNDILIRLRYALNLKNAEMVEIFKLGGVEVSPVELPKILTKYDEEDDIPEEAVCSHSMLESFFNGLIIFKRGRQEPKPGQPETPALTNEHVNNLLFKKVKIALSLTSDDIMDILEAAGVRIAKGELSAILRKEGHSNYRVCGDKFARNFLKGLASKYRG
ncbi:DUF1456 family protein [Bacillus sp. 31A1R]|uniref:DUF1456 family protein n=1 Tax=Robertmurraya mangrovi TaxID=3098077 RepID=A0ABU5IZ22_9BACI|nr:DUF1456 family protein [Bacillus sp. 31A1R]MDZ5472415.1 DUF1456 family protein [Bacillus sp. 31A1R]